VAREKRPLVWILQDGDDDPVEDAGGPVDDIQVTMGESKLPG